MFIFTEECQFALLPVTFNFNIISGDHSYSSRWSLFLKKGLCSPRHVHCVHIMDTIYLTRWLLHSSHLAKMRCLIWCNMQSKNLCLVQIWSTEDNVAEGLFWVIQVWSKALLGGRVKLLERLTYNIISRSSLYFGITSVSTQQSKLNSSGRFIFSPPVSLIWKSKVSLLSSITPTCLKLGCPRFVPTISLEADLPLHHQPVLIKDSGYNFYFVGFILILYLLIKKTC